MAKPTKAGQKVRTNFDKEILTIVYFFGLNGRPYSTFAEARNANPKGIICVKNKEYGGAMDVNHCEVVE